MSNNVIQERKKQLSSLLSNEDISQRLADLFSNDKIKRDKFLATLKTIALEQDLIDCDIVSIVRSAMSIAELGLSLNKQMGLAYIVAYKKQAQAVISYKGFSLLAKRAGYAIKINEIYRCDEFSIQSNGFDDVVVFTPNFDDRANNDNSKKWTDEHLKGILVGVRDMTTSLTTIEFIPKSKLLQLSRGAQTQKVYNAWAIEMYRAKAIKYVLSKLPIGDSLLSQGIALDNELAIKQYQDSEVETQQCTLPPTPQAPQAQLDYDNNVVDNDITPQGEVSNEQQQ